MPESAEELLIQRAKAGGVDAWEQLIVRHQGSLQDYIRYRYDQCLSGHISPEDILQETLSASLARYQIAKTDDVRLIHCLAEDGRRSPSDATR